jgi:hypothetical protein
MFLDSKAQVVREVDSLIAICEPIVTTMWDISHKLIRLRALLQGQFELLLLLLLSSSSKRTIAANSICQFLDVFNKPTSPLAIQFLCFT